MQTGFIRDARNIFFSLQRCHAVVLHRWSSLTKDVDSASAGGLD